MVTRLSRTGEDDRMDSSGVVVSEKAVGVESSASYGLRQHVLSPLEVLAQSVSLIAPCTSPTLTIPLVFALARTATCLAYPLAIVRLTPMAFCTTPFAQYSA